MGKEKNERKIQTDKNYRVKEINIQKKRKKERWKKEFKDVVDEDGDMSTLVILFLVVTFLLDDQMVFAVSISHPLHKILIKTRYSFLCSNLFFSENFSTCIIKGKR
jgi:hypothetical protein